MYIQKNSKKPKGKNTMKEKKKKKLEVATPVLNLYPNFL